MAGRRIVAAWVQVVGLSGQGGGIGQKRPNARRGRVQTGGGATLFLSMSRPSQRRQPKSPLLATTTLVAAATGDKGLLT